MEKKCLRCGKTYTAYKKDQKYCSRECSIQALLDITKICPVCGDSFEDAKGNKRYCSERCELIDQRFKLRLTNFINKHGKILIEKGKQAPYSNPELILKKYLDEKDIYND
jgi:predicted nucleic acid-binding Zn ribbon protein